MKTVGVIGPQKASLAEKPDPHSRGIFAVVKIRSAPTCTEYKAYRDGEKRDVLGHEAAGEVVEIDKSERVKVGDRVVAMPLYSCGRCELCLSGDYIYCRNKIDALAETGNAAGTATYAQYLIKQDWLLLPIPDDITYDQGSMACCGLGPTFGAMERMKVDAFDTLLITGMGPVGLGGVINGRYRGARVIAVEPHPFRRKLAGELGAHEVLDPSDREIREAVMDLTGGRGVDKAIDCSGTAGAQRLLIDTVKARGRVSFVGEGGELTIKVSADMIRKGIELIGNWHYNLTAYPRLMKVIRSSLEKLDTFIIPHVSSLRSAGCLGAAAHGQLRKSCPAPLGGLTRKD